MNYPQLLTPEEKLADAKACLGIPKIVAICGSTRFMDEMTAADCELTWAGNIVVKPGCDMKIVDKLWADDAEAEAGKQRLDDLHRAKIRLADQVLVVGDYVGDSTRAEIAYARELGKPVKFTHPEVDPNPDPFAKGVCTYGEDQAPSAGCMKPAGHDGAHLITPADVDVVDDDQLCSSEFPGDEMHAGQQ